jgi:hypothetical protein
VGIQHTWGKEKCIHSFSLRPQRKRPLGRPRHRWEDDSDNKDVSVIRNIDIGDDYDTEKANPYTGPEVSMRLRLPDLKTFST